jgi:phosphoglycolate phosphatase
VSAEAHRAPTDGADLLEGVDLLVFDKDGTLIDFHAMWGGWVLDLATDLDRLTGIELSDDLRAVLGVDRATGMVDPHGLLAATPMARIRSHVVDAVVARGVPRRRAEAAVADAWRAPDPVGLARPLADLPRLFASLRRRVAHLAIATSDDRVPTERTLDALGIRGLISGLVCADDGIPVKPSPAAILRLCSDVGVAADRTAVVGDAVADLRMGRAAGARRVIGVLSGVGDRAALEAVADVVLPSIGDLVQT